MLGRELTALAVGNELALGDAKQRIVRLVVVAAGEGGVRGGDERETMRISKIDELRLGEPLTCHTVALQFNVKTISQQTVQYLGTRQTAPDLSGNDRAVEWTVRAAGKRDQAVNHFIEPRYFD